MSTEDILTGLSTSTTELDEAMTQARGASDHADRVLVKAQGHGWSGVANGMIQVLAALDAVLAGLGRASTAIGDATGPVREINKGMTPAEVRTRLTNSVAQIGHAVTAIEAAYTELDDAERTVRRALDGGDPGALLGYLGAINQAAARARLAAKTASEKATTEIPAVSSLGN